MVYADRNNDEFQQHANSWVPVSHQITTNTREYVNNVDGMRCFITETAIKKIVTSYDSFGNKLHSFDLYYGTSQESEFLSMSPPEIGNTQQKNSPNSPAISNKKPQQSSSAQLQQFIQEQEARNAQNRAQSFNNEITNQQNLSNRFLSGNATIDEVRQYYQNLADAEKYAEQQENDRLQKIADQKALEQSHTKELREFDAQQVTALIQEKNKNSSKNHMKRFKAGQKQARCDLKAIEVMMSNKIDFEIDLNKGIINLEGYTLEGLKIRIGYDIKAKRIRTHHPMFD